MNNLFKIVLFINIINIEGPWLVLSPGQVPSTVPSNATQSLQAP
jgi:hypothetical protein